MKVIVNTAKPRTPIVRTKGANALKVREVLETLTKGTYVLARRYNYSYSELISRICDIRETPEWLGAPKHVITYMKGYMSGAYAMHVVSHPHCIPPK